MKRERYRTLVEARKACRVCAGLRNPADSDLVGFDSDEIGPWTRLHGNLDARVMVVGQDWGDVRYYLRNKGLDHPDNPTTRVLEKLLRSAGVEASFRVGGPVADLFLTNAVLCLKQNGLQGPVEQQWFTNCGSRFLRAQVEIVSPEVVVTLGQRAYAAILAAFGLRAGSFRQAVESPEGIRLVNGSTVLPVYHCGNRVLNTKTRPLQRQLQDWERLRFVLESRREARGGPTRG